MKKIRIEEVGDIHSDYSYLEVFFRENTSPFLEIGISDDKKLSFKLYASTTDVQIDAEDWEYILSNAKDFLPKALKNEDDFSNFFEQ